MNVERNQRNQASCVSRAPIRFQQSFTIGIRGRWYCVIRNRHGHLAVGGLIGKRSEDNPQLTNTKKSRFAAFTPSMSDTSEPQAADTAKDTCITHDINDLIQKEVSQIMKSFQYDIMGVISLGKDGIMRSLTCDRKVLSAQAFSNKLRVALMASAANISTAPEQVGAFLSRFEGTPLEEWNKILERADGTKTPKEKWFQPDDDILPPPLSQERWNEVKNGSEESKEKSRQLLRERVK